jgi:hypothetical protein
MSGMKTRSVPAPILEEVLEGFAYNAFALGAGHALAHLVLLVYSPRSLVSDNLHPPVKI